MGHPTVSIGLPVYNGEKFLSQALDSILSQTYSDFELIISDNGSTDRTKDISRAYAARDKRIRYARNETNRGAAWNFNNVFELSVGKYFKWAAHDDVCAPEFIERCVEVLSRDPSVVLCHSEIAAIDEAGTIIADHRHNSVGGYRYLSNTACSEPHARFADLIDLLHPCIDIFGVIRADALRRTTLISPYPGSDRTLLVQLGLLGKFQRVPLLLFFSREHRDRSIRRMRLVDRMQWFDTAKSNRLVFPHWRCLIGFVTSIQRTQLRFRERALCYVHLFQWFGKYWRSLASDLKGIRYRIS
jgi:glycosyltransferase involved in cell wall biosynthesis